LKTKTSYEGYYENDVVKRNVGAKVAALCPLIFMGGTNRPIGGSGRGIKSSNLHEESRGDALVKKKNREPKENRPNIKEFLCSRKEGESTGRRQDKGSLGVAKGKTKGRATIRPKGPNPAGGELGGVLRWGVAARVCIEANSSWGGGGKW